MMRVRIRLIARAVSTTATLTRLLVPSRDSRLVVLILTMSMPTVHKRECSTVQKAQGQTRMIGAKFQRPVLSARTSVPVPTQQTSLWVTVSPCEVLQTRQAVLKYQHDRTRLARQISTEGEG